MLYLIFIWTGLCFACLVVGCRLLHGLGARRLQKREDQIILSAWLGLGIISIGLLAIALFFPLTPPMGIGAILIAVVVALQAKSVRAELSSWKAQLSGRFFLGYGVCSVAIAAFSSQPVTWLDTGQYHYSLIRWLSEYGLPPGLALLNPQFGFISAWFAIAAPFNPSGLQGRATAVMNGFVLWLTLMQMMLLIVRASQPLSPVSHDASVLSAKLELNDWFLLLFSSTVLFLLTQTALLAAIANSASPDIAVVTFTLITAWSLCLVDRLGPSSRTSFGTDLIPLVLATAAVSIKLTALPLLPVTAGFYLIRSQSLTGLWLRSLMTILTSLILLFPLLMSQVLTSGCVLYPSTVACLELPWTLPTGSVNRLAEKTHGWGQWFGQPPTDANQHLWLIQQWLNSNQSSKLMAVLVALSIAAWFFLLFRTALKPRTSGFWLVALSFTGIGFTLLKAPLFRFGMGNFLLLPVLVSAMGCNHVAKSQQATSRWRALAKRQTLQSSVMPLVSMGLIVVVFLHQYPYSILEQLVIPPPLTSVRVQYKTVNDIAYTITQDKRGQCWAELLPCIRKPSTSVWLRQKALGIEGGFILRDH